MYFSDIPIQETSKLHVIVGSNDMKCTYTSTKTHYIEQEFFHCESGKQNCSVYAPCARICHDNYRVYSIGTSSCFCNCGLQNYAICCKVGEKCSYDAFGKYPLSKSGTSAIHVGEVNHLWAVVKTVQTIAILDTN